jgi:hypothetical protein
MILNVINLDPAQPVDQYANPDLQKRIIRNREERGLSILKQSKDHCFAVRFWEGDTTDQVFPCKNISRAFKKIVQHAKEERLPFISIAEDDIVFTSPKSWQYYLDNMPSEFDIYYGGIYAGELDNNRIVRGYSGHTLITVHENFYDHFLSANNEEISGPESHLDVWLGQNYCRSKKFIVCLPFVCKQLHGYSENKKRTMDYSVYEDSWAYL